MAGLVLLPASQVDDNRYREAGGIAAHSRWHPFGMGPGVSGLVAGGGAALTIG